ncbi:MAG: preprotein translocase subunit SecG [Clostridia bacterium]|nr:preprotein translocase subunit SecG [Clostridia bacterium]
MRPITWILAVLQLISAIAVMILVLLQRNKESDGLTGNAASSASGMGMSRENILSRWTGIFGFIFVILTIAVSTLMVIDLK